MIRLSKNIVICLFLNLVSVIICYGQEDNYNTIINSIAIKVEKLTGHKYDISGTDIDVSINDPEEKIKDPYHTLAGCFIFLASAAENRYPELPGFIGIYNIKMDSILWRSVLLSRKFSSGALGSVDATGELNRDSKVEIIIGQATGNLAINHQLWIFSWDGTNGELITQLDSYGESTIMYWGDEYELKDLDGDGVFEILGEWYKSSNSKTKTMVTYAWNGSLYGKWGKSSKYLLKGIEK